MARAIDTAADGRIWARGGQQPDADLRHPVGAPARLDVGVALVLRTTGRDSRCANQPAELDQPLRVRGLAHQQQEAIFPQTAHLHVGRARSGAAGRHR